MSTPYAFHIVLYDSGNESETVDLVEWHDSSELNRMKPKQMRVQLKPTSIWRSRHVEVRQCRDDEVANKGLKSKRIDHMGQGGSRSNNEEPSGLRSVGL